MLEVYLSISIQNFMFRCVLSVDLWCHQHTRRLYCVPCMHICEPLFSVSHSLTPLKYNVYALLYDQTKYSYWDWDLLCFHYISSTEWPQHRAISASVPKPFSSGDAAEWLQRFELCSAANGWKDETMAVKLRTNPPRRGGSGHVAWSGRGWTEKLWYSQESSSSDPHADGIDGPRQIPDSTGESTISVCRDLRERLEQAMSDIDGKTRDQLLLHQFVAGLPLTVSKQLRAAGAVTDLTEAIKRATLLQDVVGNGSANACSRDRSTNSAHWSDGTPPWASCGASSTGTVKSLATAGAWNQQRRELGSCFNCGRVGHIARDCRCQGKDNGTPALGSGHPTEM